MRIYNWLNFDLISSKHNFVELNTDVNIQWFPLAKLIHENNYFYALENNLIEGQALFIFYLQSIFRLNLFQNFNLLI